MRNSEKDELEMEQRREAMLSEGFKLFAENGIENVSMQQVADACNLGIATLYRYYSNKLALVLAVGTRKWQEYTDHVRRERAKNNADSMTAAQELAFYLGFYIDLYQNHKDLLKFNQNFNSYVINEGSTGQDLKPYIESINVIGRIFHDLYEKGKKDGTIRTDLPEDKMFATTSHIMMAVGVRYAQGVLYAAESDADRSQEYELLKKMILREFVV